MPARLWETQGAPSKAFPGEGSQAGWEWGVLPEHFPLSRKPQGCGKEGTLSPACKRGDTLRVNWDGVGMEGGKKG